MAEFILSDNSINSYGFRVLTEGIDLSLFKKNPVMLYDHNGFTMLPIGKWEDIKQADGQLKASDNYDQDDEQAVAISKKVEKGMINGVSIGFEILETSTAPEKMLPGQTRPTVTKSVLREASITPFPANKNALKLYAQGEKFNLNELQADKLDEFLPHIQTNTLSMNNVKKRLNLGEDAREEDVLHAIEQINADKETAVQEQHQAVTDHLLAIGEKLGTVSDKNKERMKRLANADFELAVEYVIPEQPQQKLSDKVNPPRKEPQTTKKWEELTTGEVEKLRKEDTQHYRKLFADYYGFEPEFD